ncbi:hypothetical protein [Mucilaginibacter sp. SG564]|uniref:hypothetical protein n=1 Tax=Mucilaginibacter sp. SG564 TaxID=2587022 RepID=UPI00352C8881
MGGFSFRSEIFVEVSAVGTHPDYQGRGYARQLILSQISKIEFRFEILSWLQCCYVLSSIFKPNPEYLLFIGAG